MSKKQDQELRQLRSELSTFHDEFPKLSDDDLFVVWFLFAFVTGDKASAVAALTGHSGEKGIDAIHVDHTARLVSPGRGKWIRKPVDRDWGSACQQHNRVTSLLSEPGRPG